MKDLTRLIVAVFSAAILSACGAGAGQQYSDSGFKKGFERATGETCVAVNHADSPWLVDLPATERNAIEASLQHGLLLARKSECGDFELLDSCYLTDYPYSFEPGNVKIDAKLIQDTNELQKELTSSFAKYGRQMGVEENWSFDYVSVSMYIYPGRIKSINWDQSGLRSACSTATHYVRRIDIGAYQISRYHKSQSETQGAVGPADWRSRSSRNVVADAREGDYSECARTGDFNAAVCRGLLQVHLEPLPGNVTPALSTESFVPNQVPTSEYIQFKLESEPGGATVFIDGIKWEKQTPCTIEAQSGNHKIYLEKGEDYEPREAPIVVYDGMPVQTFSLTPRFGLLTVRSDPTGADVILDGQVVGKTPLVNQMVKPLGQHEVKVRGEAVIEQSKQFTVSYGGESVLLDENVFRLNVLTGNLLVTARDEYDEPVSAEIYFGGASIGYTGKWFSLPIGAHEIVLYAVGGGVAYKTVQVGQGNRDEIQVLVDRRAVRRPGDDLSVGWWKAAAGWRDVFFTISTNYFHKGYPPKRTNLENANTVTINYSYWDCDDYLGDPESEKVEDYELADLSFDNISSVRFNGFGLAGSIVTKWVEIGLEMSFGFSDGNETIDAHVQADDGDFSGASEEFMSRLEDPFKITDLKLFEYTAAIYLAATKRFNRLQPGIAVGLGVNAMGVRSFSVPDFCTDCRYCQSGDTGATCDNCETVNGTCCGSFDLDSWDQPDVAPRLLLFSRGYLRFFISKYVFISASYKFDALPTLASSFEIGMGTALGWR